MFMMNEEGCLLSELRDLTLIPCNMREGSFIVQHEVLYAIGLDFQGFCFDGTKWRHI